MQCPNCGSFFKVKPADFQNEGILDIHCPCCGLIGSNYFTKDVLDLAHTKAKNMSAMNFERLKKKSNGILSVSLKNEIEKEYESPVVSTIDAMEPISFHCCKKTIKINPLYKMTGCYCPFCGVINYDFD